MIRYNGDLNIKQIYIDSMSYCEHLMSVIEGIYFECIKRKTYEIPKKFSTILRGDFSEKKLFELGILDVPYKMRIFANITRDLLNFMTESLENIYKINPQIGFALARRPLIEDAYYLEKLYINPKNAIDLILNTNANSKSVNAKKSKENIDFLKYDYFLYPLSNEFIHKIRFDKERISLKSMCDISLHISTNRKNIAVKSGELNHIFIDDNVLDEHINYYTLIVPLILTYVARVVQANYEKIINVDSNSRSLNNHVLTRKFTDFFSMRSKEQKEATNTSNDIQFASNLNIVPIMHKCSKCNHSENVDSTTLLNCNLDYVFICKKCGNIEKVKGFYK